MSIHSRCVGYFYWPENQNCYPKAGWTSDMWTASSTAALRPGSVIGLVGGDCNSFNGGVPPAFRGTCCNAPATDNVDYRTCSNVVSWAEVARLNNVDLLGWDLDQEVPGTLVESEGQCVQNCLDTEG
ncbi:hypothetical protein QFC19_007665 [Naganishia cerealis]|uniref:Uncharacterized protein n=1 Tax=Naganishia cerealis TaxID=610337 RepID=A0ACC2V7V4_9TREE|nr:hypothetical protein QFC19_007665 [Naganishia cerealis]